MTRSRRIVVSVAVAVAAAVGGEVAIASTAPRHSAAKPSIRPGTPHAKAELASLKARLRSDAATASRLRAQVAQLTASIAAVQGSGNVN